MNDNHQPKETALNSDEWDEDCVEAAQSVVEGIQVARKIMAASGLATHTLTMEGVASSAVENTDLLLQVYDRYQQELRVPFIVEDPDDDGDVEATVSLEP